MRMPKERAPFAIGVCALIFETEENVLVGRRRDYDIWNLPGGVLEAGETLVEGIVREVQEETGLIVEVERLVGIYSKPYRDEVVLTFRCLRASGTLCSSEEAREWRFFSIDELPRNLLPKHRERILDAARDQLSAILRVQPGPSDLEVLGLA